MTEQLPPEPLRGEPPVLTHDPATWGGPDASVRVVGAVAPVADEGDTLAHGPVPGLEADRAAPTPVAPAARRRRRRRWFGSAAVLAVVGAGLLAAAVLLDGGADPAHGAAATSRLTTPVLSVRRGPELLRQPVAARAVRAAVDPVVARFPNASCVVVSDGRNDLTSANPTSPLAPASNTKLLTASAALHVLGADTRLQTTVAAAAAPQAGRIAGDLYLVGGGDPLLGTVTAATRMTHGTEPTTSLEALADQVVAAGVHQIDGSVIGDGSRYDDQRRILTWPQRYITDGTASNLGALMVNDAWTQDPVDPAGGKGGPAPDPAAHAAEVFTRLLTDRGVTVTGAPGVGTAPPGAATITSLASRPVSELVGQMLAFSDNTTAEMLIKELAAHDGSQGSTTGGIQVLVADLTARGLPVDGLVLYDGSGLSRDNRATCDLLDAVIASEGPDGPFAAGLARPGQPGTLEDRFGSEPLRSRIAAKTGTLNDVTALSGWVTTDSGTPLVFSTVQNPAGRGIQAGDLALQGQLLQALLSYPQAPPVDQLSPLAPDPT